MASLNIIYREKDVPNIREYDVYVKNGGYEGLKKALSMEPKAVIDEVKASNLRGRGGAGFPAGVKWSFIPQSEPVKYVTVNADESETGHVQRPPDSRKQPAPVDRRRDDLRLGDSGDRRLHLPARRILGRGARAGQAHRRSLRQRLGGRERRRHGLVVRAVHAPRRGRVHLRRGKRAAGKPRREARSAARAPTVPGEQGRRSVRRADRRQQRRDADQRPLDHASTARRSTRRSAPSKAPARKSSA